MVQERGTAGGRSADAAPKQRVSISLDPADHAELKRIAARQRVSLAWVVREAVRDYIDQRAPLFRKTPPAAPPAP